MSALIGLLLRAGLPGWVAKLIGYALPILLLLGALWWLRHDAYSDGVAAEKNRWEQAIEAANEVVDTAIDSADSAADVREDEWAEQVQAEKDKIDEAVEAGNDPFDVLFPAG